MHSDLKKIFKTQKLYCIDIHSDLTPIKKIFDDAFFVDELELNIPSNKNTILINGTDMNVPTIEDGYKAIEIREYKDAIMQKINQYILKSKENKQMIILLFNVEKDLAHLLMCECIPIIKYKYRDNMAIFKLIDEYSGSSIQASIKL